MSKDQTQTSQFEGKKTHRVDKKVYEKKLKKYQWKLLCLQQLFYKEKIPAMVVLEGYDAAGKGGVIKRMTEFLDPRGFHAWSIAAPGNGEKNTHYLQRFWRKIPMYGNIIIFDRSWYGRVLVERIEGFAKEEEWKRAYYEINDFEKLLSDDHYLIIKFWLEITPEEQLLRFQARAENRLKRWKLTNEDWRNRDKWDQYEEAAAEMFKKTDKKYAPWYIIDSNDKRYARLQTLKTLIHAMERHLVKENIPLPVYETDTKE